MRYAVLAISLAALAATGAEAEDRNIPPGQEAVLAEMLGGGGLPAGCALAAGEIDRDRVIAHYACGDGRYTVTLREPAPGDRFTSERFALVPGTPPPPAALLDTLLERVRAHEGSFRWSEPPTPVRIAPTPEQPDARAAARRAACRSAADAAMAGRVVPVAPEGPSADELRVWLRPIYECLVIARDDADLCRFIEPTQARNCHARWMFFHAARSAPADTNWPAVIAPALHEDCVSADGGAPTAVCDQVEDAVRRQIPESCPSNPPELRGMCEGLASSDPKRCPSDSSDCKELAGRLVILRNGGLAAVARESTERDRLHARAALGEPDACAPTVADFLRECEAARR